MNNFKPKSQEELLNTCDKLYEKAYNIYDLICYIKNNKQLSVDKKLKMLVTIDKMKKEVKNEKIMILFILDIMFFRSRYDLENIMNI